MVLFDIKERAWDAADCLRFAAVSAVPLSGVSTVVELRIVGSDRLCSLDPDDVFVYVIPTVAFHKLFQLLQLSLGGIGEMKRINEFPEILLGDLVVNGAVDLEVVLLHLDGPVEVPGNKGVSESNEQD